MDSFMLECVGLCACMHLFSKIIVTCLILLETRDVGTYIR